MRESKIEAYFVARVMATGGIVRKAQWVNRSGCPDRWCGWPLYGRTAWVELKGDGGRLSIMQEREIGRLRACGERVEIIKSLPQVDTFVEEMTS